jgi:hypothetical protein
VPVNHLFLAGASPPSLNNCSRGSCCVSAIWCNDKGRLLEIAHRIGIAEALLLPHSNRQQCGVDLYLDQQALDTTTPAGRLMFQVTGAPQTADKVVGRCG